MRIKSATIFANGHCFFCVVCNCGRSYTFDLDHPKHLCHTANCLAGPPTPSMLVSFVLEGLTDFPLPSLLSLCDN